MKWSKEAVEAASDYNRQIDVQYQDEVVEMLDRAAAVQFKDTGDMTLYRRGDVPFTAISEVDGVEVSGFEMLLSHGVLVPVEPDAIVHSDVPDGQGSDYVTARVPREGRYAIVRIGGRS